jgi:arylsulfatase A-like enzyme
MGMNSKQPNFIVFCTDEHRWDHLGCNGNTVVKTPNIDRLAKGGVSFTNAHCSHSSCMPSRATMFTGLMIQAMGLHGTNPSIPPDVPTLPQHLADAGYRTHSCGKLHISSWGKSPYVSTRDSKDITQFPERHTNWNEGLIDNSPNDYFGLQTVDMVTGHVNYANADYKVWLEEKDPDAFAKLRVSLDEPKPLMLDPELHYNHWIADRSIDFIKRQAKRKMNSPFFLWCSFPDPHEPFAAVKKWSDEYRDVENIELPSHYCNHSNNNRSKTFDDLYQQKEGYTPEYIKRALRETYGMISHIDEQVGRMMSVIEASGEADNTVVIFTSDHGEQHGEHDLLFKGLYPYEGHTRVPFILNVPWAKEENKGQIVNSPVSSGIDLMPTILDLAQVPQPGAGSLGLDEQRQTLPGESLAPVALNGEMPKRKTAMVELSSEMGKGGEWVQMRKLVTEDYKCIVYYPSNEVLLFDAKNDPYELTNIADKPEYKSVLADCLVQFVTEISRTQRCLPSTRTRRYV